MKAIIICLLILVATGSRCSDKHKCEGSQSCCKDMRGDWKCCPYGAGICCTGTNHCCPPSNACSADGMSCYYDPYGFLSEIGAPKLIVPSLSEYEEGDDKN